MKPRKFKVAMISHVPIDSIYGAGTSLRGHLRAMKCQKKYSFGLILPKSIRHGILTKLNDAEIMKTFSNVSTLRHRYMRCSSNYDAPREGLGVSARILVNNVFGSLCRSKMIQTFNEFAPHLIHLNSLVLAPIALWQKRNKAIGSIPVLLHARELLRPSISKQQKHQIASADVFICIDAAVRNRLLNVMDGMIDGKDVIAIQNPFRSNEIAPDPELFKNIDIRRSTVFAIVGQVSSDKGVEFVCEAFLRAHLEKCVMLVVGQGASAYSQRVKALCDRYSDKLRWLGNQPDLIARGFFNGVHAVVRGETSFCTGRTVYEALYSGADVILPGSREHLPVDSNLATFRNQVFFYQPGNIASLSETFQLYVNSYFSRDTVGSKVPLYKDNYAIYAQDIHQCYSRAIRVSSRNLAL